MRSRRRVTGVLAVAALLVGLVPTGAAGAPARPAPSTGQVRTVTLITGDQVLVTADGRASIRPGPGRTGVRFGATRAGGKLRVVPNDAVSGLRAGRLDPRLFEVTTLLEFGYDRRPDLPLIITGNRAVTRAPRGAKAVRAVPGGAALRAAKSDAGAVWQALRDAGPTVWLDGLMRPTLDASVPQIGAPAAWAAGYTGAGVKVAVVDSGIDADHPDLAGRVVAAKDFTEEGHNRDLVGHGTHVAATIGSVGTPYKGVAPGVQLLSAKVCEVSGCLESAVLAGMQWAAEQGAKVINMSLGARDRPGQDPMEAAIEELTARHGALFVVSAGNAGADERIGTPGSADAALTVGAVTKSDDLAELSSRGPRSFDAALKPDITAPGQGIVAAASRDSGLAAPGERHVAMNGTSMAAPHVAGAAAILAQRHPDWTPARLKAALMGSAKPNPSLGAYAQGAGRVDVARAIGQSVLAEPASLSYGRQLWPHQDDRPITRTLTYRNLGAAAVTLQLSLAGGAPDGMFTLSDDAVTVAPGGTAGVTLTADTSVRSPDGFFGGRVVATAGGSTVTTPFAVDKEIEKYDVTLRPLDRAGQPTEDFFASFYDPASKRLELTDAGAPSVRLAKGRYVAFSTIFGADDATMITELEFVVDRPRTLAHDARRARPISVTPPQADAEPGLSFVQTRMLATDGTDEFAGQLIGLGFTGLYSGQVGNRRHSPLVRSAVYGTWKPAQPTDPPYLVQLAYERRGRAFTGFRKRVTADELAVVRANYTTQSHPTGKVHISSTWPSGHGTFFAPGGEVRLSGTRLEYHNTDAGVRWHHQMFEGDPQSTGEPFGNWLEGPPQVYAAGRTYVEERNRAPYGPGVGGRYGVTRRGDTMTLAPTLLNDRLNWDGPPFSGVTRLTLDRDGRRLLDTHGWELPVEVPPGEAPYRLGAELTRGAPNTLSTKVSCVWTFRSGMTRTDRPQPLPLSVVRFRPRLDGANTAPAGTPFAVPLTVQRQPGSPAGAVRTLTVEVSYDDGATWQRVSVARDGQRGVATLRHPGGTGFVSLRAASTDTAGNTVSQTVIRAYRYA